MYQEFPNILSFTPFFSFSISALLGSARFIFTILLGDASLEYPIELFVLLCYINLVAWVNPALSTFCNIVCLSVYCEGNTSYPALHWFVTSLQSKVSRQLRHLYNSTNMHWDISSLSKEQKRPLHMIRRGGINTALLSTCTCCIFPMLRAAKKPKKKQEKVKVGKGSSPYRLQSEYHFLKKGK